MASQPSRDCPTFDRAIELFLEDMFALGRLNTEHSIAEYRRTVRKHAEDAGGAGPHATTRDEVKASLRRWSHPNTKRRKRTMLVSFYTGWWRRACGRTTRRGRSARRADGPRGYVA